MSLKAKVALLVSQNAVCFGSSLFHSYPGVFSLGDSVSPSTMMHWCVSLGYSWKSEFPVDATGEEIESDRAGNVY